MTDDPSPEDATGPTPSDAVAGGPDAFVEFADEAVHEAAVRARAEARGRRERATELATWGGTLRDLAERRAVVVARTSVGGRHRGRLVGVAPDHVVLELPAGGTVLIALAGLRQLAPEPSRAAAPAGGDRGPAQDRLLVDALDRCLEQRRRVVLRVRDVDDALRGELAALGDDVLTFRPDGAVGTVYVPVDAIVEVLLPS